MKTVKLKERLEDLLKYLDINQKEFSKFTGVSENTLSNAKKGKNMPNLEFFNAIFRVVPNLNAQWLYMGVGEMFADPSNELNHKDFSSKPAKKKDLKMEDCTEELENAEMEIEFLKNQVEDKNEIITLLKKEKKGTT
ncbi:MAG TPA: helix-turn-helix transcriptional regulator [Cytophagaceae bacterium]|jgi:transcriptional regulator with XRE-family HTH domain